MNFQEQLRNRLRSFKLSSPPKPWKREKVFAVGGLTEVGFADKSDLLLIVSHDGRGLLDCRAGEIISRDRASSTEDWYQPSSLEAEGIGSLLGQKIKLAGLHGGGLPHLNSNGWSLEAVSPDWPAISIFVSPPGSSVLVESFSKGCEKIYEDSEIRAFGFSPSGNYFILATSDSLTLFSYKA